MSNYNETDPGPIPNRWLKCPRKSESVIAEKFLAFKTPLSSKFKEKVPIQYVFTPEMIFGYTKTINLKLGLWIDLTNTKRYYDKEVIENKGAKYVKLKCRGHNETPSKEQTTSFIQIVDDFINDRPFDVIGVHCTHGFNRTGFLIVSYMVERLDCPVDAALSVFAQARPPGIYKEDYIRELYRRYDDEVDTPPAPETPSWCFEHEDVNVSNDKVQCNYTTRMNYEESNKRNHATAFSLPNLPSTSKCLDEDDEIIGNGHLVSENLAVENKGDSTNTEQKPLKKKRKREQVKRDAKFMSGVSGVTLILEQPKLSELQRKVQDMCGWQGSGFPGSQPVSMDMENINFLHLKPYKVSWKADGTRYMMLINARDEIYFFDRNNSCFQVDKLTFPRKNNLNEHLTNTLLDGEMVIDKVDNDFIPRYLVYDIIKFENEDIGSSAFHPDRVRCIKEEIIAPRHKAFYHGLANRSTEPFGLRDKEFWDITTAGYLLSEKFAAKLCHEPDGLIFQPSADQYTAGQSKEVLKWKPLNMNSIDFLLRIVNESGEGIEVQNSHKI
ncbi:mRNA-capping enzyme isoform X2 [Condylostylus longicornis]|uniref:mRNA-capping enzyme isoform X2 n=1 Tax=Condylostylus longicornis TaxID=2530218 RepID=UPI00244E2E79|nr:mRNA-capping enzyme isoform X2 [Condylostylus longicornis]